MAYGKKYKPQGLLERAAKKRAAEKASNKNLAKTVAGLVGATGAGIASGGNPAAIMAGYQGGEALTGLTMEAASDEGVSDKAIQDTIGAGLSAFGAADSMKKAAKAAQHQKELLAQLKRFGIS